MTLPSPNLDDRTFTQLFEEARKLIPVYAPEWSDHNEHDPGITLIQLFAWLAENQQYYLNRIRHENYIKYLKLLGIRPQEPAPAKAEVTFSYTGKTAAGTKVPKGAQIAADGIVFETAAPLTVVPAGLRKVITISGAGAVDNTEANSLNGLYYSVFGDEAERGSCLYLGFAENNPFPANKLISLTFNVFGDYRDPAGRPAGQGVNTRSRQTVSSAVITWEYFQKDSHGLGVWAPLAVTGDETLMLSGNGRLSFIAPGDMASRTVNPFSERCCWLRAVVTQAGYELPPKLDRIVLNTVSAVQWETMSEAQTFSSTGQKKYTFEASYLSLTGLNYVQSLDEKGSWTDRLEVKIEKDEKENTILITLGGGSGGTIPPRGRKNLRLISCRPELGEKGVIGMSTGRPCQKFCLGRNPVIGYNFRIQVGEECRINGQADIAWHDWIRVDSFDASGPGDTHFVLDVKTGEICFGDGVNGAIPPVCPSKSEGNIRLVCFRAGGGKKGNVLPGAVNQIINPTAGCTGLKVESCFAASGGGDGETVEEAAARASSGFKTGFRAVTSEDFERIACATPGIRVARARAIPLFRTGAAGYPSSISPALVTVVVVPFSLAANPVPSEGFLLNVYRHLCRHRLITTEISVKPPDYVVVSVTAEISVNSRFNPESVRQKVISGLNRFLHPLTGGPEGSGWPFGRSVYKSEIYQLIEKTDGVDYVQELVLAVQGKGTGQDGEGNFSIPPQGLVYPGEHRVEVIDPNRVCRLKGGR